MKICVVGLGYIGLPTAAIIANSDKENVEVVGVDRQQHVVDMLNSGEVHIEEPGLGELVKDLVKSKLFRASVSVEAADVFLIAVPTPNSKDQDNGCDYSYVISAVQAILPYLRKENTVIIESTIGPFGTEKVIKPVIEESGFVVGEDVFLVHCPERVLPGKILDELVNNNRIVGGTTPKCSEAGARVYELFVKGEIIRSDARTAEMSKLMENTFRDVNIALANELTKVCATLGVNVLNVIEFANKHPRVNIHQPGPGVGGHCLAIDPYFVAAACPEQAKIIKLARDTNNSMPAFVVDNTKALLAGVDNPKVAVFGVTYKGNIDDMRESPALEIIRLLEMEGFQVAAYDPHVESEILSDEIDAVDGAHMILVLTDHNEFIDADYEKYTSIMAKALIFDTKNCIRQASLRNIELVNFGNLHESISKERRVLVTK